jgi:hypothetical protein
MWSIFWQQKQHSHLLFPLLKKMIACFIWNFRCAAIPAIFVSYPNTKFKRFGKGQTTIYRGSLSLKGIVYCFSQTTKFILIYNCGVYVKFGGLSFLLNIKI